MDVQTISDGGIMPTMFAYLVTLLLAAVYTFFSAATEPDPKSGLFYLPTAGGAVVLGSVFGLFMGGGFWITGIAAAVMVFWWVFNRIDRTLPRKTSDTLGAVWLYTTAIPGTPFMISPFLAAIGTGLVLLVLSALFL